MKSQWLKSLWLFQRVSAIFLAGALIAHMGVMHYGFRISYPAAFKLAFLLSAVFHGFYGLWGIAEEYIRQAALLAAVRAFIGASALILVAAGIYMVV